MDETDLISTLQTHLDSALSVPIRANAMDDERPVPVVFIEDWETQDYNFNNSALAGEATGDFDSDGLLEYEKYLNFSFKTRIEILVRHTDEVDASRLKEDVKHELRLIRENPQSFHNGLKSCNLRADGNPTNKFTEPKEAESMVSARFDGDHTVTLTPSDLQEDTLEQVTDDFTFNP